jgi:hypothetical protein
MQCGNLTAFSASSKSKVERIGKCLGQSKGFRDGWPAATAGRRRLCGFIPAMTGACPCSVLHRRKIAGSRCRPLEGGSLGVRELQSTTQLSLQDPVFGSQIFVPAQLHAQNSEALRSLEICTLRPYRCGHDHASFRPRFAAVVPCSQPHPP